MIKKIAVFLFVLLLSACASVPNLNASKHAPPPPSAKVNAEYKIGATDVLQIIVWRQPDLSVQSIVVSPDGTVSLPLVGKVHVSGLTVEFATKEIQDKFSFYVKEPKVTVSITQSNSQEYLTNVRVGGSVRTPASVPYHQGATVIDVVLHSGGPNDVAAPNGTILHRIVNGKSQSYAINLGDILEGRSMETNYPVYPGDIITVPEKAVPLTTATPIATLLGWGVLFMLVP